MNKQSIRRNVKRWLQVLRDKHSERFVGVLENADNPSQRCCLGHACHALGVSRTVKDNPCGDDFQTVWYGPKSDLCSKQLPLEACNMLNITALGNLKGCVSRERIEELIGREIYIYEDDQFEEEHEFSSLSVINDYTNLQPKEMATLIQWFFDRDMFEEFPA